jgi:hypothetical protein
MNALSYNEGAFIFKQINMTQTYLSENDFFKTQDLALAGVLSLSYPLEAIDFNNPPKAQFLFKRDEKIDELVHMYWRGELKVEPMAYFSQLRVIKTRLRSNS